MGLHSQNKTSLSLIFDEMLTKKSKKKQKAFKIATEVTVEFHVFVLKMFGF